ncbi:hypothetical protein GCK32_011942 [Trichostrongylus colubriformis]|uniref:Apple domain-containing protein n=1 Tax=Trichostrongylus colubriformis TaxID=6319 RepID=A0AAN8FGF1_TRICO
MKPVPSESVQIQFYVLQYDDEEPFAVTQSLLNSIEHADEAVTRVNIETLKTPTEEDDTGYGPSPLDSSATTQKAPSVETRTASTVLHTEDNINWSENYQQVQGSPGMSPYLHEKSKTRKQPGLKKSSFQGMFFMPEDLIDDEEREQMTRERSNEPSVKAKPAWPAKYHKAIDGRNRDRIGETVATKRRGGGYVVSGTRYYFDNRIDVDVEAVTSDVMKEDYGIRENSREQIEMMKDPRFAVEVELSGVKMPKTKKYVQDGIKLHTSKISQMYNEPDPKSMVSHKRLGDRLFERRVTEIGGKQVTVELGNKHLHGVDLIVRPGSVVHGPLPSDEEKAVVERSKLDKRILIPFTAANHKSTTFGNLLDPWDPLSSTVEPLLAQSDDALELPRSLPHNEPDFQWSNEIDIHLIERCFFVRTDTELTGSPPIMKYIGESKRGCIVACARNKRCHSINYSGTMSTCEIFDEANATTMHMQYHLGYTFYMPKRTDVSVCLNDVLKLDRLSRSPELEPNVTCGDEFPCKTSVVLDVLDAVTEPPTHYRLLPSKAECSRNTAVLFIRSAHSRNEKGTNLDTVSDISEDDCLFSCLTNQAADSHPVRCASAEYDEKGERCTLSSEPRVNGLLTEQPSVTFYEKICVAREIFYCV